LFQSADFILKLIVASLEEGNVLNGPGKHVGLVALSRCVRRVETTDQHTLSTPTPHSKRRRYASNLLRAALVERHKLIQLDNSVVDTVSVPALNGIMDYLGRGSSASET
jgi:hypothetical protein